MNDLKKPVLSLVLLALVAIIFVAGWAVNGWRLGTQLEAVKRGHAETLGRIATKTAEAQEAVRKFGLAVNGAIAAADAKHFGELEDEKAQTQHLRDCIAAGTCGVRLITKYVYQPSSSGSAGDSTASVGHDTIALDEDVQRRVLDLRDTIAEDAAKLSVLQEYAQQCWRATQPK